MTKFFRALTLLILIGAFFGCTGGKDETGENESKSFILKIAVNNSSYGAIEITPLKKSYEKGESVTLIPKAVKGYRFKEWGGENGSEVINNSIVINSDKTVTAFFEEEKNEAAVMQVWDNITGYSIAQFTSDSRYPDQPSYQRYLTKFETNGYMVGDLGIRVVAYLVPQQSGEYKFWIASNEHGQLWLSSDENPVNKKQIAYLNSTAGRYHWENSSSQVSNIVVLEAGKKYYIEGICNSNGTTGHFEVSWALNGNSKEVISGKYLLPYEVKGSVESAEAVKVIPAKPIEKVNIDLPAFPGAEGFGAGATGGRGGKVIYVTNLNASGPGSLNEALGFRHEEKEPRYILFKVSGLVDNGSSWDYQTHIEHGNFTLAGQTAKGGIIVPGILTWSSMNTGSNDDYNNMIIRHLRSRPDGAGLDDAIRLNGAQNVILDHCSFGRASDEEMQIAWNKNFTVQNCIFAETPGDHSDRGGILIKYGSPDRPNTNISFHHNLVSRIMGRMPQTVGSENAAADDLSTMQIEMSNNMFWDPGCPLYFDDYSAEKSPVTFNSSFRANIVNNYFYTRDTYTSAMFSGLRDYKHIIYMSGNKMNLYPELSDWEIYSGFSDFYKYKRAEKFYGTNMSQRVEFPEISYIAAENVKEYAIKNCGAFPRDPMDKRLIGYMENMFIDSTSWRDIPADDGHAFSWSTMAVPELDSDDDGMADWWEIYNGLNPMAQDHNGKELSFRYTGRYGYDNVEVYLNRLSDNIVSGSNMVQGSAAVREQIIESVTLTGSTLSAGGKLNINVVLKKSSIKKAEVSLDLINAPFAFPSPDSVDITSAIVNGKGIYSCNIPAERTSGDYSIMIHIVDSNGKDDYKVIDFKL